MGAVVLLTGSTGNIGTYLLASLANNAQVEAIWCLNRASGVQDKQPELLRSRGLNIPNVSQARIHYLQCTFEKHKLGLDDSLCAELAATTAHIIYCAWPVDFNRSFKLFLPSIRVVSRFIELAQSAAKRPPIFFVSSISAAGNWTAIPGARRKVPNDEIDD
jgi:thioester reductase-like protein